jgi:diguanylate cyclase (GGDEF)-like protein/PAS domain S-box-containing protein
VIWLKNEHGVYLACNPMFEKFFGAKESEILGKTDYDFVDKNLADFFRENDRKAMLANKDSVNEEWLTFADGSCKGLFETIKTPLRNQDGSIIGVLGIARNITQRKLAENELRIAATAFDSQEGILVTDANGIILRVNHAFTDITGYSSEEAVGKKPSILNSGRHKKEFYDAMWKTITTKGHWEGEVWNRRKNGEIYPEHLIITASKNDAGEITNYVGTLTDLTLRKEAEKQIEDLAYIDPLTRIPNRRLFLDRLHQAIATSTRNNQRGALLFIDLDHFKKLNDTLGHDMGDLLLQQVALRLTTCVREGDTIARLGGDEFVVLLEDLSENEVVAAEKTETIGAKILNSLSTPYQLATHQHHSTPSIGATLFHKHDIDVDVLLKQADIAMYQAKDSGRNTLRFFDPLTQANIKARAELESDLRKAIDLKQFALHYQVQVNNSGHPIGAEVLVRWIHPERGIISPFNFIPLAEETGLILPLGLWVLDATCKQIKAWQQDPIAHDLILAVNVSAKQFLQPDFLDEVQKTIHQNGIDPKRLKLELTESSLLNHVDEVIAKMQALKQIGIRFSLDDFGTGYSSLQYLRRLPLDQLKIDQSFVRDIAVDSSDRAIVRTIIAMAHSLDLNVIAEGVETEEQRDILKENHCTHYQGYLYSKPVPINEFESLLKTAMQA